MSATPGRAPAPDPVLAALDPAEFSRQHFDWTPYPYQRQVMNAVLLQGKKRVAWVAGRRVGKTDTIANIALQKAIREPGTKVAIFAPSFRQACFVGSRIRFLLKGSEFEANVVRDKADELRLRFGRDARGKPRDSVILTNSIGGKVRGEGADMLIVDESAFCKREDYSSKVLPFILDRPEGVVIHTSTMWADDDHFAEALRDYATRPDGATFTTPTRMRPGITEAKLKELRASMTEAEFLRECECEPATEGGVFTRRQLVQCFHDYEVADLNSLGRLATQRNHSYLVGVDWGKKQDRAVIAVVEQSTQHKVNPARVVFLQVYEPDPDNAQHYTTILEHVQRVAKHVSARKVVVDLGEGGHQVEVLRRSLGSRLEGYRFTRESRDFLVDNARYLVEKGLLELPEGSDELRRAFLNVQRTDAGYVHASRRSKDVFDAVALALNETGLGVPKKNLWGFYVQRPVGLYM